MYIWNSQMYKEQAKRDGKINAENNENNYHISISVYVFMFWKEKI